MNINNKFKKLKHIFKRRTIDIKSNREDIIYLQRYQYNKNKGYFLTSYNSLPKDIQCQIMNSNLLPYGRNWHKYIGMEIIKKIKISKNYVALIYSIVNDVTHRCDRPGLLNTYVIFFPNHYFLLLEWNIKIWKEVFKILIKNDVYDKTHLSIKKFINNSSIISFDASILEYLNIIDKNFLSSEMLIDIIRKIKRGKKVIFNLII